MVSYTKNETLLPLAYAGATNTPPISKDNSFTFTTIGANGMPVSQSTFDEKGTLICETDFKPNGTVPDTVTTFRPDGSASSLTDYRNDGSVAAITYFAADGFTAVSLINYAADGKTPLETMTFNLDGTRCK